jgi:hypothetical protein
MKKNTIDECHSIAKSRGGKCLSTTYQTSKIKMSWKCSCNHEWEANFDHVKRGQWCPKCAVKKNADKKRDNIQTFHEIARIREGKCLSDNYFNSDSILEFACQEGHKWSAIAESIKAGTWCPKCAGKITAKESLVLYKKIASEKEGFLLSRKYIDKETKLEWKCKYGHTWWAVPNSIKQGTWCPECAKLKKGNSQRSTIEEFHQIAKERGGECLSEKYENNHSKLEWRCKDGHVWSAVPASIKSGTWCPKCNLSTGEEICRIYFELVFKVKFPKTRPSFLRSRKYPSGLELDGYNEELGIAFEHQGIQHYKPLTFFGGVKAYRELVARDEFKRRLCAKNNVVLFEIKDVLNILGLENFVTSLKDQITTKGYKIENDLPQLNLNSLRKNISKLEECSELASTRKGKCLSSVFLGGRFKLEWECEIGHRWNAAFGEVKGTKKRIGTWCPECAKLKKGNSQRSTIEEFHQIAKERGGECLSEYYKNNSTKLEWKCKEGHTWWSVPNSIKQGTWCPECAKLKMGNSQKSTIEEFYQIAKERGGECLSFEYKNSHTKLKWRCKNNHVWYATPMSIKGAKNRKGTWCPECSRVNRS